MCVTLVYIYTECLTVHEQCCVWQSVIICRLTFLRKRNGYISVIFWCCLSVTSGSYGTRRGIKHIAFPCTFRIVFPGVFRHWFLSREHWDDCVTMRNLHLSACLKTVQVCLCVSLWSAVKSAVFGGCPWKHGAAGSACVFRELPPMVLRVSACWQSFGSMWCGCAYMQKENYTRQKDAWNWDLCSHLPAEILLSVSFIGLALSRSSPLRQRLETKMKSHLCCWGRLLMLAQSKDLSCCTFMQTNPNCVCLFQIWETRVNVFSECVCVCTSGRAMAHTPHPAHWPPLSLLQPSNDVDDAVCSSLTMFQTFVSNCWSVLSLLSAAILMGCTHVPASAPVADTWRVSSSDCSKLHPSSVHPPNGTFAKVYLQTLAQLLFLL